MLSCSLPEFSRLPLLLQNLVDYPFCAKINCTSSRDRPVVLARAWGDWLSSGIVPGQAVPPRAA